MCMCVSVLFHSIHFPLATLEWLQNRIYPNTYINNTHELCVFIRLLFGLWNLASTENWHAIIPDELLLNCVKITIIAMLYPQLLFVQLERQSKRPNEQTNKRPKWEWHKSKCAGKPRPIMKWFALLPILECYTFLVDEGGKKSRIFSGIISSRPN